MHEPSPLTQSALNRREFLRNAAIASAGVAAATSIVENVPKISMHHTIAPSTDVAIRSKWVSSSNRVRCFLPSADHVLTGLSAPSDAAPPAGNMAVA